MCYNLRGDQHTGDGFYNSKQGTENLEVNELHSLQDYSNSDKTKKESFYLYNTPEKVTRPSVTEHKTVSVPSK